MLHASFLCAEEIIGFILTEKGTVICLISLTEQKNNINFRSVFNINIVRKYYVRCIDKN